MPRPIIDITGKKFGRLHVVKFAGINAKGHATFLCHCACGTKKIIAGFHVRRDTRSCGICSRQKHGHRLSGQTSATYRSWRAMVDRCTLPSASNFSYYGGRGIRVCRRWRAFKYFYLDLGKRPVGTTLGRFNDTGNYRPGNCAWMTRAQQNQHRRA